MSAGYDWVKVTPEGEVPVAYHAPGEWTILTQAPLLLVAACVCGVADCAYTTTGITAVRTQRAGTNHRHVGPLNV
jgi:hypothetical protein